jgi:hypothetical protein
MEILTLKWTSSDELRSLTKDLKFHQDLRTIFSTLSTESGVVSIRVSDGGFEAKKGNQSWTGYITVRELKILRFLILENENAGPTDFNNLLRVYFDNLIEPHISLTKFCELYGINNGNFSQWRAAKLNSPASRQAVATALHTLDASDNEYVVVLASLVSFL